MCVWITTKLPTVVIIVAFCLRMNSGTINHMVRFLGQASAPGSTEYYKRELNWEWTWEDPIYFVSKH